MPPRSDEPPRRGQQPRRGASRDVPPPGEETGRRGFGGIGEARVSGQTRKVAQGDLVVVPAGRKHNFVNTGPNPLVLYTVYGPPEHADGAVHKTKEEADELEEAGKDEPPTS